MEPNIVYNIQTGPYWNWQIALDLFLGGAGVGAFLFSVALFELWGRKYRRIPQTAAFLAPILVLAGLVVLMLKLGRPFRLFYTFTNFAPTSPLWWGGIFQTILIVGLFWYALKWRHPEPDTSRRMLGRVLVPIAVIVGAYHGLLLAVIAARPLWNTGPVVVAALLAFATTGIAAVMLTHLLRMKLAGRLTEGQHLSSFLDDMKPVQFVLVGALGLQLVTFFFWWFSLFFGSLQDRQALTAANEAYGPVFWLVGIGIGLVLPLMIGGLTVWRTDVSRRRREVLAIGLTSVLILVGGFFFRLAVVLGGQVELPIPSLT